MQREFIGSRPCPERGKGCDERDCEWCAGTGTTEVLAVHKSELWHVEVRGSDLEGRLQRHIWLDETAQLAQLCGADAEVDAAMAVYFVCNALYALQDAREEAAQQVAA